VLLEQLAGLRAGVVCLGNRLGDLLAARVDGALNPANAKRLRM